MKSKIFTFILLMAAFGLTNAQDQVKEFLAIPDGRDPVIDGIVDENDPWQEEWLPMDVVVEISTTSDMSAEFQMLHNDSMIFIVLHAEDATPQMDPATVPNSWERDNIEIFFHMASEVTDAAYVAGVTSQLRFQRYADITNEEDDGFDGGSVGDDLLAKESFTYAVVSDDDGWIFEGAFPFSGLNSAGGFDGTNFFFDIKYADNSTGLTGAEGRTQQNYYYDPDDNKYQDATLFTAVTLSDTEVELAGIETTGAESAYAFVSKGALNFRNVKGNVSIYSITGALVQEDVIGLNGSVSISSLNPGVYFVKAENMTAKFVVK